MSSSEVREKALAYIRRVSEVLGPSGYESFVSVLNEFTTSRIDTLTVINRVCDLLGEHPTLAQGFNSFLPQGYKMPLPHEISAMRDAKLAHIQKEEDGTSLDTHHSLDFSVVNFASETELTPPEQDLFAEAVKFVSLLKDRYNNEPDKLNYILQIVRDFSNGTKSIPELDSEVLEFLSDSSPDLVLSWMQFLPPSFRTRSKSAAFIDSLPEGLVENPEVDSAEEEVEKKVPVRPTRRTPTVTLLQLEDKSAKTKSKKRPTIRQREVQVFTPLGAIAPIETDELALRHDEHAVLSAAKRVLATTPGLWVCFLRTLDLYSAGTFSNDDLFTLWGELFKDHLYMKEALVALVLNDKDTLHHHTAILAATPGFKEKLEKVTPSYRKLPNDYIHSKCSGRGNLENSVLNDSIVSAPAGSESGAIAHERASTSMTILHNTLLKNEDDMAEVNMMIDLTVALIRGIEVLARVVEVLQKNSEDSTGPIKLPVKLPSIYQYILRREFGPKASDIEADLYENPTTSIPIILNRLKSKHVELLNHKSELEPIWKDTVSTAYERSIASELEFVKVRDAEQCKPQKLNSDVLLEHAELQKITGEISEMEGSQEKSQEVHIVDHLGFGEFPVNYECILRHQVVVEQGIYLLASLSAGLQESSSDATAYILKFLGSSLFGLALTVDHVQELAVSALNLDQSDVENLLPNKGFPQLQGIFLPNARHVSSGDFKISGEKIPRPGDVDEEPMNLLYGDTMHYVLFRLLLLFFQRLQVAFNLCRNLELAENCVDAVPNSDPGYNPLTPNLGETKFKEFISLLLKHSLSSSLQDDFDKILPTFFGPLNFFSLSILPNVARRAVVQVLIILTRTPLAPRLSDLHCFVTNHLLSRHHSEAVYIHQNKNLIKNSVPQLPAKIHREFSSQYRHHVMSILGSRKLLFEFRIGHFPLRLNISILGSLFATPCAELPFSPMQLSIDNSIISGMKYLYDDTFIKSVKEIAYISGDLDFQKPYPYRTLPLGKMMATKSVKMPTRVRPLLFRNLRKNSNICINICSLEARFELVTRNFVYTPNTGDIMVNKIKSQKIKAEEFEDYDELKKYKIRNIFAKKDAES
ncbi:hypothetical protein RCL1_002424 [Eukaryota sp. TZLM3-RCL]